MDITHLVLVFSRIWKHTGYSLFLFTYFRKIFMKTFYLKPIVLFTLLASSASVAQAATYYMAKPVGKLVVSDQTSLIGTSTQNSGSGSNTTPSSPATSSVLTFNESTRSIEAFTGDTISQSFILTNSGSGNATGLSFTTTRGSVASTTCGTTLAKGASCEVVVQEEFTQTADSVNTLTVLEGTTSKASATLNIDQLATIKPLTATPSSVALSSAVGSPSSKTITFKNDNDYAVQLGMPLFSVGSISNNTCGATLAPAASCSMDVSATPNSTTAVNAKVDLAISKNNKNTLSSIPVVITGIDAYAGHKIIDMNFDNMTNLSNLAAIDPEFNLTASAGATLFTEPNGNKVVALNGYAALQTKPFVSTARLQNDFTMSMDVKFTSPGSYANSTILSTYGTQILVGSNQILRSYNDKVDYVVSYTNLPVTLTTNVWHNLKIIQKSGVRKVYWDNTFVGNIPASKITTGSQGVSFGGMYPGDTHPYGVPGYIDNLFVADVAP